MLFDIKHVKMNLTLIHCDLDVYKAVVEDK